MYRTIQRGLQRFTVMFFSPSLVILAGLLAVSSPALADDPVQTEPSRPRQKQQKASTRGKGRPGTAPGKQQKQGSRTQQKQGPRTQQKQGPYAQQKPQKKGHRRVSRVRSTVVVIDPQGKENIQDTISQILSRRAVQKQSRKKGPGGENERRLKNQVGAKPQTAAAKAGSTAKQRQGQTAAERRRELRQLQRERNQKRLRKGQH